MRIWQKFLGKQLDASWVQQDSFVPLKKMTQEQLDEAYVPKEGAESAGGSIQDKLLEYPGVLISKVESRVYPYGECTAHLLGYVQQINAEELKAGATMSRASLEKAVLRNFMKIGLERKRVIGFPFWTSRVKKNRHWL